MIIVQSRIGVRQSGNKSYRELKGTVTQRFDREKGLCYADGHLDIGGMGFDFKVYADEDRIILLLPTFTKFLVIHRDDLEQRLSAPVSLVVENHKGMTAPVFNQMAHTSIGFALFFYCLYLFYRKYKGHHT